MIRRSTSSLKGVAVIAAAMLALTGFGTTALADHGSDEHGSHHDDQEFGPWLYEGTCDSLSSAPLKEIGDLEQETDADDIARLHLPDPVPSPIWMEDEDVAMTVSDLTTKPHAIVVRATVDRASDVIACGVVTNAPAGDAPFSFPLATVNGSGYTGSVAVSSRIDTHEVDLIVGIWEGTSAATPVA